MFLYNCIFSMDSPGVFLFNISSRVSYYSRFFSVASGKKNKFSQIRLSQLKNRIISYNTISFVVVSDKKKRFISSGSVGPTYVISSNFGNTERILEIRNSAESYCLADSDRWKRGSRYLVVF